MFAWQYELISEKLFFKVKDRINNDRIYYVTKPLQPCSTSVTFVETKYHGKNNIKYFNGRKFKTADKDQFVC